MSSEKQSESPDAPSEAEQIEQQLAGLAETHFARKMQEIKTSQEGATIAPILARLASVEKALEEFGTAGRQSKAEWRQAIETLLENVSKQEVGINSIVQFLRKQAQAQSQPLAQAKAAATPAQATVQTAPAQKPSESPRPRSRLIPERKPAEAVAAVPVAAVTVAAVPVAREQPVVASGGNWHQAVFGLQLAADAKTAPSRRQLLDAAAAGEKNAATLTGLLLMFQAAAPDRRPQMLKDVGEAFYRWRPDALSDPDGMRAALVDWLTKKSEESGKVNTIELVHPGDRFDNTRHHAQEKGGEIVGVFGWVVLREGGKVYTKASVAVQ